MRLVQTLVAEEEVRRTKECSPNTLGTMTQTLAMTFPTWKLGHLHSTFHLLCHAPMPHFKEGGAGSRELLTSGVDGGVVDRRSVPGGKMWVEQQLVGVWRRGVRKIFAEKWLKKHADREGKAMGYWGVAPLPQKGRGRQS